LQGRDRVGKERNSRFSQTPHWDLVVGEKHFPWLRNQELVGVERQRSKGREYETIFWPQKKPERVGYVTPSRESPSTLRRYVPTASVENWKKKKKNGYRLTILDIPFTKGKCSKKLVEDWIFIGTVSRQPATAYSGLQFHTDDANSNLAACSKHSAKSATENLTDEWEKKRNPSNRGQQSALFQNAAYGKRGGSCHNRKPSDLKSFPNLVFSNRRRD